MIRSMTAFARQGRRTDWGELVWEIRAVNHRYLEPGFRLPDDLRSLESACRAAIGKQLRRGKIECSLKIMFADQAASDVQINEPLLQSLIRKSEQLSGKLVNAAPISALTLLRWPGVVALADRDPGPVEAAALEELDRALVALVRAREAEGARIRDMLLERCTGITTLVSEIRDRLPEVRQRMRDKLTARLAELDAEFDRERVEQELVMLAQKMDVDEELDRLNSHIEETRNVLDRNDAVGRRLDFLMQEFNREANTLASKSNDAETTRAAVDIKVLVEQMREQVQNVE